jgi:AraC family transcriptional regulator
MKYRERSEVLNPAKPLIASIDARKYLPSTLRMCSRDAGWHSLLLRKYAEPPSVKEFEAPPTSDQLIVLLTRGGGIIERFSRGKWDRAKKLPGSLSLSAPGEQSKLRWRGTKPHESLHLHLPAATMNAAVEDLRDTRTRSRGFPHVLNGHDPVIAATLLSIERAAVAGLPDLYAESAAHFLALHLLSHVGDATASVARGDESERLRRVDDLMRASLSIPLSLDALASVAGCTTFQLIRFCKSLWGETPFARLTRLRMERAQYLLLHTRVEIMAIAFECGYSNPSHFATAFRRIVGVSPSEYRRR